MNKKELQLSDRNRPQPHRKSVQPVGRFAVKRAWLSLLCLLAFIHPLAADPILFTFSGTGSGNLGGTMFSDAPFTFELYGDTINSPRIPGVVSTFDIGGVGSGVFSARMHVVHGAQFGKDEGDPRYSVLLSLSGPELRGYDMRTSFAPVTFASVASDPIERFYNIPTSLGPLALFSARDVTFSAMVVPEPSSVALIGPAAVSAIIGSRTFRKGRNGR